MPRITQAQRQIFNTQIQGANLAAIGQAQAGLAGAQRATAAVFDTLAKSREQELTAQSAEFNSGLNLQFHERFNNVIRSQNVQRNPSLARSEVSRIAQSLITSNEFKNQPQLVQGLARRNIARLQQSFNARAINFENEQSFRNTVTALNKTQSNFELQALTTDTDINQLLQNYTATVTASAKSGALTINQAEAQIQEAASSIVANRAQQFINNNEIDAAKEFIADKAIQEHLGARGLQSIQSAISRRETLNRNKQSKLNRLRSTNPWKLVQQIDTEPVPEIDLTNTQQLAENLDERLAYIQRKNRQYGIDLPLLSDLEKDSFIGVLDRTSAQGAAAVLNQAMSNIPDAQQDLLAQQIFEDEPAMGVAISVADDDAKLAQSLLNGRDVIKKKLIRLPSELDINEAVNQQLAGAVQQPGFRNAIQQAVRSAYADRVFTDNDNSGLIQPDVLKQQMDRLIGPLIQVNGVNIVGFRKQDGKFINQQEFDDLYNSITSEKLSSSLGDVPRDLRGNALPIDDVLKNAELIVIGNGQYVLNLFDEFAVNRRGEPYILDMRKLSLARRAGVESGTQLFPLAEEFRQ